MIRMVIGTVILGVGVSACAASPQDDRAWEAMAMTYGPMKRFYQMRAYQEGRLPYLPPSVFEEEKSVVVEEDEPRLLPQTIPIRDAYGNIRWVTVPPSY